MAPSCKRKETLKATALSHSTAQHEPCRRSAIDHLLPTKAPWGTFGLYRFVVSISFIGLSKTLSKIPNFLASVSSPFCFFGMEGSFNAQCKAKRGAAFRVSIQVLFFGEVIVSP